MKRVLKYNLNAEWTEIWMPYGSTILTAQSKGLAISLYAVSNHAYAGREVKRTFFVVGTDEIMPEGDLNYISTILTPRTMHVFEQVPNDYEVKQV